MKQGPAVVIRVDCKPPVRHHRRPPRQRLCAHRSPSFLGGQAKVQRFKGLQQAIGDAFRMVEKFKTFVWSEPPAKRRRPLAKRLARQLRERVGPVWLPGVVEGRQCIQHFDQRFRRVGEIFESICSRCRRDRWNLLVGATIRVELNP